MSAVYQKVVQYIDNHIKEDITIVEIADTIGYSVSNIYKIFKVYSPYPIMEYIRRKKLYFAANEMYSGRKLYNIALDYGYDTPAGFYKAFKSIFGCSPKEYKNNIMKEGTNMYIDSVKTIEELNAVLAFVRTIYPAHERFVSNFVELEKRAKEHKHAGLVLGIAEGEEEFYAKMGYVGKTLVQSEKYSIDELKTFNEQYKNYEITGTSVYEYGGSSVNQIWLNVPLMDKVLKKRFENKIGNCWVQVIVNKEL